MTGRFVECSIDEMDRPPVSRTPPCGSRRPSRRPGAVHGWGGELATCRKFALTARTTPHRNRSMSQVGLRVSEACKLDLADIKWDLGSSASSMCVTARAPAARAPRELMVPLINGADRMLRCSSRRSGASSTTTALDPVPRCSPPSARAPTAPRASSATTRCATVWPPRRRSRPEGGAKGVERRFRTERPSSYERAHARAVTSIAHRGDPSMPRSMPSSPRAGRWSSVWRMLPVSVPGDHPVRLGS